MDNTIKQTKSHSVSMDNRKKISMSGIDKVISSTDTLISLLSTSGGLVINGKNLKIIKFSAEDGNFSAEGDIDCIKYSMTKSPLLKRMFK